MTTEEYGFSKAARPVNSRLEKSKLVECGLHFQKNFPQTKLVRVIKGAVFDVAVDLRSGSETYGKWYGIELTEENKKQFLIPRGFAHGFLVLSETAEFCYKCDDFYHPNDEGGMAWNDPEIGIEWPGVEGYISFLISAWELIHFKWDGKRFLISGRSVHEVIKISLTEIQDHTELDQNVVKL